MPLSNAFRIGTFVLTATTFAVSAIAQQIEVRTDTELEELLFEAAGIRIDMPELGYIWDDEDIQGEPREGSFSAVHMKMIYYLIHWGPIEVEEITEEYVRERIPRIWPSEGMSVQEVRPMTVAGHPALYAEAIPKRPFYRPQFLIWNCPESGRQFIADMNYNTLYRTPRSELQAQIEATVHTLACHTGAPTSPVPGHVERYDSPRFGLSFSHPLRWYVFENPYGVPHPAYRGVRDGTIGSVLAWPKDRQVRFRFHWEPMPEDGDGETTLTGSTIETFRAAVGFVNSLEDVESFTPEASETVTIGGRDVLKVMGSVTRKRPENPPQGFSAEGYAEVLLIDSESSGRRLFVLVWIDNYNASGLSLPPDRDIFDRWAIEIASNLEF